MASDPIPAPDREPRPLAPELEAERKRVLALLEEAERDLEEGRYIEITPESMSQLAESIHRKGIARLEISASVKANEATTHNAS